MNVLSLFDGLSGGQVALQRADMPVDNYFAAEIDPYAAAVAAANHPNTIFLGDVARVRKEHLPKIHLVLAGSPCTSFSSAGLMKGFSGASGLILHFFRLLKELKPDYFLLENVKMKKQWRNVISASLPNVVWPIEINSDLVSAQLRSRLYWTDLPNVTVPKDRELRLQDVVTSGIADRDKSYCIDASYYKFGDLHQYRVKSRRQVVFLDSSLTTYRHLTPLECERLQTLDDDYTKFGVFKGHRKRISNTQRYKMIGNGFTVDVIAHLLQGLA